MKLYKKNKNKSIQTWTIRNRHSDEDNTSRILVQYGQLDGKMQSQVTTILEGKQGRTVEEQGEFEMQSMIRGKKDEGYKSEEELGIYKAVLNGEEQPFYKVNGKEGTYDLDVALSLLLPDDATDAQGNVKPMLAQPIVKTTGGKTTDNWKRVTYPIAGEPKLDGVRCLIFFAKEGTQNLGFVTSISREGKFYDFGTTKIREKLHQLFLDNPNVILDGELYVHGMPQNRISGAMRSGKYQPEIHDNMEYHVYDIVDKVLLYKQRKLKLYELAAKYESFKLVNHVELQSKEEVDNYESIAIENGYEGIMLKPLRGLYEIGKRSYNNLKVKQFLDEEFEIIGHKLGKRGVQDLVFKCITKEGKEFEPTATGTVAQKQSYVNAFEEDRISNLMGSQLKQFNKIIGKMATVKFKFYSEYGVPNHCQVKDIRDYE